MKSNLWKTMAVLVVLSMALAACGPTAKPTEVAAPPTAAPATAVPTTPPEPKIATFIWTQEFDTLNPLYTNMWFSAITFQIWNCHAWDFDDQNAAYPVLVKEMPSEANGGVSADGKTITLKLRDDIVWSDGTPITSEDFAFTHQMTIDPKNAVASTYPNDQLEALETPDAHTVVMKFAEPFAPWQGTFWHGLLPAHILKPVYEQEGTLDTAEWGRNPTVGCGPFAFEEWESGSFARFVANENYWAGRPKIDEIFIRFVPDDASQVAALKAGDGDLGTFISYSDIPTLEEGGVKMVNVFSGYNEGLYFYLDPEKGHPALQDANVRKAIALAFDRASLCKDLLLDLTKPAVTDWDNTPWVDPSIEPYPYNPEEAKALLDAAGWIDTNNDGVRDKDGVEFVIDYGTTTREIRKDTQAVFQQAMQEVGIKVNLLNYDSDLFFAGYGEGGPAAKGDLDIFEYSATPNFPDPDVSEWRCDQIPTDESPDGTNWMATCDEELDAMFKLQATQVDFGERQQTFFKITKLIYDKVYWLGYWWDPDIWAVGPRLQNVKLSGATPFYNIIEWDMSQ
ncbi:MAG: peptide ABC transporter substrate-binding protein [Anaerolineae bacterium]|nr:peptide ABC transporter substrate-binding protein [Anaerolineae bacterium]